MAHMKRRMILLFAVVFLFVLTGRALPVEIRAGEFLVLCYHAIPDKIDPDDNFSISKRQFAEQMEYLRTHGYHPVSLDDIVNAREGKKVLPEKPVLLTFDDAYISYFEFVVPLLEKLGYPSVLAVVGKFIEDAPPGLPEGLMSWEQIGEASRNKLVTVVSHSYDLHKGVIYNPQGNEGAAAGVRMFDPVTNRYETDEEYLSRIDADFRKQNELFRKKLGFDPKMIVWPYGVYNSAGLKVARNNGYEITFTLDEGLADVKDLGTIKRNVVTNPPVENFLLEEKHIEDFIRMISKPEGDASLIRAVQVDLDLIYDPDSEAETEKNLGRLIDRLYAMKVNTVFLQAFADPRGTGNIESVYFWNRVLPVRADIFSHAAHQMIIRGMAVYAWMPVLGIELPDPELNERLKVRAIVNGKPAMPASWYRRLTPFSEETLELVKKLYEDLAAHSQVRGILFQDDAYLTDTEDFHPAALRKYREKFGEDITLEKVRENSRLAQEWTRYKTETMIDFTGSLMDSVRQYRPGIRFARNLYSSILENPVSEEWFAQNYELFLRSYDYVVVMAYPQMDRISRPSKWLKKLVGRAKEFPGGTGKTVFKLQAYDWRDKKWIKDTVLLKEMRDVLSSGGRHIAYYPDNFWENRPALNTIKLEMSGEDYPFHP